MSDKDYKIELSFSEITPKCIKGRPYIQIRSDDGWTESFDADELRGIADQMDAIQAQHETGIARKTYEVARKFGDHFDRTQREVIANMDNDGQRFGQAWFNAVYKFDPEFADSVRGTDKDPFYTNDKNFVSDFINDYDDYLEAKYGIS